MAGKRTAGVFPAIRGGGSQKLKRNFPLSRSAKTSHATLGLTGHGLDGNGDFHKCSRIGAANPQFTAKFLDTLPHAADAHADTVGASFHHSVRNSLAVIAHRPYHLSIVLHQSYPSLPRSGMSKHVGDSFLNDGEDCSLHFSRQPGKAGGLRLQNDFDTAALCESL